MAGKKKLRSYALYYNLGLAIIWDVIGLFFFALSLLGVGIPFSIVLDFVAIGTALLFRYLHKLYFFKRNREIKAEFRVISEAVKRSKKKVLAEKYAQIRGQFDIWLMKGRNFIFREMIRMLWTFLLELIPFLGDFSPTWTIKAYFELVKFGQQKRKLQAILYQMEAMRALMAAEDKLGPGYSQMKRGIGAAGRLAQAGGGRAKGASTNQNSETRTSASGVQSFPGAANTIVPFQRSGEGGAAGSESYQQNRGAGDSAVRYNETRSQGRAYYNDGFRATGGNTNINNVVASRGAFQSSSAANINVKNYSEVDGQPSVSTASFGDGGREGGPQNSPFTSDSSVVVNEKGVNIGSGAQVNGRPVGTPGVQTGRGQGVTISDRGISSSPSNNQPKST